ncbi:MAG: bifunctional DNA-formamidopyrimidine glycosylase/DNA-(apurinic or apyrimidinic site) lyase [Planctomycetota bacterium]|nr:MAG: bifunctional DNA-formamidopyrimidine glycosylase/DNA-(apurinic or apyrimidinic site) lyase [Planctomycetota bacterium]
MPELPEVETMCRGIRSVVGHSIARVFAPPCPCRPIAMVPTMRTIDRRLRGQVISRVRRLGKRVVLIAGQHALVIHPRMTGMVCLNEPPNRDYLRLQMELSDSAGATLFFWDRRGLGTVELVPADELDRRIADQRLGPDALDIALDQFVARLSNSASPIKVVLLDQRRLAGIGNLYASEILHAAKVHPSRRACDLKPAHWSQVYTHMRRILNEAIAFEGSTLSDGTYRNALNHPGGYQSHHRVYDRAGHRCFVCRRGRIRRIVQAQRSTFYCPICQPLPRRS